MSGGYQMESPCALRACVSCGRSPEDGLKLKKCTGCAVAPIYCSKQCQKNDWPIHNNTSLANTPCTAPEELHGFGSLDELTQTFHDYLSTHEWALEAALKVSTFLRYDFGRTQQPDHTVLRFRFNHTVLRFRFTRTTTKARSRNPARAFTFTDLSWHEACDAKRIDTFVAMRTSSLAAYRRVFSDDGHPPPPDSTVLALFTLEGAVRSHDTLQCFPWYQPLPGGVGCTEGERVRAPLKDLLQICTASLNTQFPLRNVRTAEMGVPVPGRYARVNRKWVWQPLFTSWVDYLMGRTDCGPLVVLEGLTSGLLPHHLLSLYYNI
ncbi:hypothetical protein LXA43DRAFT_1067907 [Ganoderma leucocontextum]|nr:hypothetical protein LXA43DRAFT_1067907 [Ganoderma leucocontextum]